MADAERQPTAEVKRGSGTFFVPEPRFLTIGQVAGAHGIGGEIKVNVLTEDPGRFGTMERVWLALEGQEPVPWPLERFRLHKERALLKLEGCDDRTMAERLQDYLVLVPFSEAIPLEEGEYYEHQIVGMEVWTTAGELLGEVEDILYTGANEVYIVRSARPGPAEILIPAISDVVQEIDPDTGRMIVEPMEGLF